MQRSYLGFVEVISPAVIYSVKLPANTVVAYSIAREPNSTEADLEPYFNIYSAPLRVAPGHRISPASRKKHEDSEGKLRGT